MLIALSACLSTTSGESGIDGDRALQHAKAITSWGPHPPGSAAQKKVGLYLIEQLKLLGLEVRTRAFTAVTSLGPKDMLNIWGVLPGKKQQVILLASHYDSKYFTEFEFVGANDGASTSGMILELARVLAESL